MIHILHVCDELHNVNELEHISIFTLRHTHVLTNVGQTHNSATLGRTHKVADFWQRTGNVETAGLTGGVSLLFSTASHTVML